MSKVLDRWADENKDHGHYAVFSGFLNEMKLHGDRLENWFDTVDIYEQLAREAMTLLDERDRLRDRVAELERERDAALEEVKEWLAQALADAQRDNVCSGRVHVWTQQKITWLDRLLKAVNHDG